MRSFPLGLVIAQYFARVGRSKGQAIVFKLWAQSVPISGERVLMPEI